MQNLHIIPSLYILTMITTSCYAMNNHETNQTPKEKFKKITIIEEYCTTYEKPLPTILNQDELDRYYYDYNIIQKPEYKKSLEYPLKFNNDIITGSQIAYDTATGNLQSPLIKNLLTSPNDYLKGICDVMRALYVNALLGQRLSQNNDTHQGWSLVLIDEKQQWKKFFLDNFYNLITGHKDFKKYILDLDTKHLKNLPLPYPQTTVSTSMLPSGQQPPLILDHDTLLFIPFHSKVFSPEDIKNFRNIPTDMLFIKTNNLKKSGWKGRTTVTEWTGAVGEKFMNISGSIFSTISNIVHNATCSENVSIQEYNKEHFPKEIEQTLHSLSIKFNSNEFHSLAHTKKILEQEKKETNLETEKKDLICSVLKNLARKYDHINKRMGEEFILDTTGIKTWAFFYHLLTPLKNKDGNIAYQHSQASHNYFPLITTLQEFQRLIFLYNNESSLEKQDIKNQIEKKLKAIKNKKDLIIKFKAVLDDCISDADVKEYYNYIIEILDLITILQRDDYLFEHALFESKPQETILRELLAEEEEKNKEEKGGPQKNYSKPNESLVLPTDPREEQE